jgi:hypothetical protein
MEDTFVMGQKLVSHYVDLVEVKVLKVCYCVKHAGK